jgi:hypothetical protein
MFSSSLIAVALAGVAAAFTPPGFEPASSNNLTVAFGSVLAVNGVDIPKAGKFCSFHLRYHRSNSSRYGNRTHGRDHRASGRNLRNHDGRSRYPTSDSRRSDRRAASLDASRFSLRKHNYNNRRGQGFRTHQPRKYLSLGIIHPTISSKQSTTLPPLHSDASQHDRKQLRSVHAQQGLTVLAGNSFNVTAATNTTAGGATNVTSASTSTVTRTSTLAGGASATATGKGNASTTAGTPKSTGGAVLGRSAGSGAIIAGLGAFAAAVAML